MKKNIALCMGDARYAGAFKAYVDKNEKERLSVECFYEVYDFLEYYKTHKVDMLIVSQEMMSGIYEKYNGDIVVMSGERYVDTDLAYESIYMYQAVDDIISQLYVFLAKESNEKMKSCANESKSELYCVFSPIYPVFREEYARELVRVLGKNGKALFVNLAEFTAFDDDMGGGISEVLYYLNEDDGAMSYKMFTLLKSRKEYKEICGVKNYKDIEDMSEDDLEHIIAGIQALNGFDSIVFDVGNIGSRAVRLFKRCSKVFVPVGSPEDVRVQRMLSDYSQTQMKEVIDRFSIVRLPQWWSVRREMRYRWIENGGD